jgi:hypothetical protein
VTPDLLDHHHHLPLFFYGLRETGAPFYYYSNCGTVDLKQHGSLNMISVVPQLIVPLKKTMLPY